MNPYTYVRYLQVCDYIEETWLRIVFTEPMLMVRIIAINPALDFVQQMSGNALLLAFMEQEIPYDTEFEVTLSGKDLAGNELATTEYSFTTIKKGN